MQTQSSLSESQTLAPEPWLTAKEAAAIYGVHFKTLQRKARAGELPGHFKFNRWYFKKSELDCWLTDEIHSGSQSVRVN